ncbi:glycoside hydrolase family 108 protein [Balnearium lithotrophicum]|nr:glycosyl hydrolase 108 family protein [Balnearium lithotrophicum]
MRFEGGYVNDKDDPGSETKFGISKKQYPNLDIKSLTKEQAKEIYWKDYWLKAKCPDLEAYHPKLAIYHFDTAVNTGIRTAGKILQRAINKQGFKLYVDGIVGPITVSTLKECHIGTLLRDYLLQRELYYKEITDKKKVLRKFFRGWINRTLELYLI